MKCFARWLEDNSTGLKFRDQTILQFGDSWNLLCSFVLLNPGSAEPIDKNNRTDFLRSKSLPYFVEPKGEERYVEFKNDSTMRKIAGFLKPEQTGGVILLYNLFNLKNSNSTKAIKELAKFKSHPRIFTSKDEINFCKRPVILAPGRKKTKNTFLINELEKYKELAPEDSLYKLTRAKDNNFSIIKIKNKNRDFIDSYHPWYTSHFNNKTSIGELKI